MPRFDAAFKALSDPTRRQILHLLRGGPAHAGELAEKLALAPNALSFHLKVLKHADLVFYERDGQRLRYYVNTSVLDDLLRLLFDTLGRGTAKRPPRPRAPED